MCLAVPMKLVKIDGENGLAEAGGLKRKVNLSFLKKLKVGDYVLVHAGFAMEKVDTKEAKRTLCAWQEVSDAAGKIK